MRNTSRSIAALCLLSSAACATDGITAPRLQPEALASAASAPADAKAIPSITLVCVGSISPADGEPLYIVDGVVQNGRPDVDALDIAEIEVIRDASEPAVYQGRTANGVILITTRSRRP